MTGHWLLVFFSLVCVLLSNDRVLGEPANGPPVRLCGMSTPGGLDGNEFLGKLPERGQYPWVMALFSKGEYFGTGSLIGPGLVLTAAHLVSTKSEADIVVRAGTCSLAEGDFEERQVFKIMVHEAFEYEKGSNNLALIFLRSPFELKPHILTICLPSPGELFHNRTCKVAGWGARTTDKSYSNYLKVVDLPMVDRVLCQNQLRQKLGSSFNLPASLICAGGEVLPRLDLGISRGDGGAPLLCALNGNRYVQAGIVSWGAGENVKTSTMTNVALFRDWIDPHLRQVVSVPNDFH